MTEQYTYASQLTPNGIYNFAFRYNDSVNVSTGDIWLADIETQSLDYIEPESNLNMDLNRFTSRVSKNNSIRDNSFMLSSFVLDNIDIYTTDIITFDDNNYGEYTEDITEMILFQEEQEIARMSSSRYPTLTSVVNELIRWELGEGAFHNRLIGTRTRTQNGRTATANLTNSHSIHTFTNRWYDVLVNTAITVISVWASVPVTTLKGVISLALTAYGVYVTVKNFKLEIHVIDSSFTKVASVNGINEYWAGWQRRYESVRGDLGWSYPSSTILNNRHWDFNDNIRLMDTALDNHFRWN